MMWHLLRMSLRRRGKGDRSNRHLRAVSPEEQPDASATDLPFDLSQLPDNEEEFAALLESSALSPAQAEEVSRQLFATALSGFESTLRLRDPLEAELVASALLGAARQLSGHEDVGSVIEEAFLLPARGSSTPLALALLRALEAVADTAELRARISAYASELSARGVADPRWAAMLGQVEVGGCWQLADVFGDQASLLCTFHYGKRAHAFLALLDFNHGGGWVKDLYPADDPDRVLKEFRKEAKRNVGLMELTAIGPGTARRLLEDGIQVADMTLNPDVTEEYLQTRAVALARCRTMPDRLGEDLADKDDVEVPDEERDRIVRTFFDSDQARGLRRTDAEMAAVSLLVDYGCDYDDNRPLRVSPAKTAGFLLDFVHRKVILDAGTKAVLPSVVGAWNRWVATEMKLAPAAREELFAAVDSIVLEFEGAPSHDPLAELMGSGELPPELAQVFAALSADDQPAPATRGRKRASKRGKVSGATRTESSPAGPDAVYQLKISLRGARPPIWRRLRVPAYVTLAQLHEVIQVAFGWDDSHLHAFYSPGNLLRFGAPGMLDDAEDENGVRLFEIAPDARAKFAYTYDFGDDWEHQILVEDIQESVGSEPITHAECVTGRRAAPVDDSGGIWGWEAICEAVADPSHPDHEDRVEWLDGAHGIDAADFDPAHFSAADITRALRSVPLPKA